MPASLPRTADSWTLDALHALPDNGNRYELIEGRLLVSPPPARRHLRVATRLHRVLLEAAPRQLAIVQNAGIVDGPERRTYFTSDFVVTPEAALDIEGSAFLPAEILLAVEVLSPGSPTTDDVTKRYYYAKMGIPQYWIVDPLRLTLLVMRLDIGRRTYLDTAEITAGKSWATEDPFPVSLRPAEFC